MKRIILVSLILLALTGCAKDHTPNNPVRFYYPKAEITFGSEYSAIAFESRESESLSTEALIRLYLDGPAQQELENPIPDGVELVSLLIDGDAASLVLTDPFSELSGLPLTVASICLSKTVIELAEVQTVVLSCETKPLDGESHISISKDQMILVDESIGSTDDNTAAESAPAQ